MCLERSRRETRYEVACEPSEPHARRPGADVGGAAVCAASADARNNIKSRPRPSSRERITVCASLRFQPSGKLLINAAEAAIGKNCDDVARFQFASDGIDDLVGSR